MMSIINWNGRTRGRPLCSVGPMVSHRNPTLRRCLSRRADGVILLLHVQTCLLCLCAVCPLTTLIKIRALAARTRSSSSDPLLPGQPPRWCQNLMRRLGLKPGYQVTRRVGYHATRIHSLIAFDYNQDLFYSPLYFWTGSVFACIQFTRLGRWMI